MNQWMIMLILQSLKNLYGESSNQVLRYTNKIVVFDEIIEIYWKKLKCNYQVFPKNEKILHSNNVVLVMFIMLI